PAPETMRYRATPTPIFLSRPILDRSSSFNPLPHPCVTSAEREYEETITARLRLSPVLVNLWRKWGKQSARLLWIPNSYQLVLRRSWVQLRTNDCSQV